MPKSNQALALEALAEQAQRQTELMAGVIIKLDRALELLGDPEDEALGNDPDAAEVPPLDVGE